MNIHSGIVNIDSTPITNGYVPEETISEGRVFVLTKARFGTKYVILKTTRTQDAIHQEILRREYEIGKNLSHGCVVSTIDFAEDTPVGAAIVLEYIDGVTLREYLSDHSTGIEAKRKPILNDILSGVDYLHHRGILHNDIKPDNILINKLGHARIIDFGFADNDSHYQERMLGTTRGYASPELIKHSDEIDARSDIYAIGCIIQQMFPNRYKQIVKRCIHPDKTRRFSNIEQLAKAWHRRKQPYRIAAMLLVAVLILLPTLLYIYERTERIEQAQRTEQRQQLCDSLYQAIDHEFEVQYTITRDSINAINAEATTQAYSDALIMIAHFYRRTRIIQEEILSSATDRTMQMQLGFHCNQVYGTYQNQLVTDAEQWKHTVFQ